MIHIVHATAGRPGAIAILQLIGDSAALLREVTGVADWPLHRARLVRFGDIDEGVAVRASPAVTQLMPHGGPRVVQRLIAKLVDLGATLAAEDAVDPIDIYPEAGDQFEALMLLALSRAESPLAIELLADQPRRWRHARDTGHVVSQEDRARSERLNRLIVPPIVVVAGAPNVGKSTLSNALLGRSMSIALDMPGTTRDYVAGRIELAGLVVDWHDTPGLRPGGDLIEQRAIEVSRRLMERADILIAMTDPSRQWPQLPRAPNLWVMNKVDLLESHHSSSTGGARADQSLPISARTGAGLPELVAALREALVPRADVEHPGPWLLDERLVNEAAARRQERLPK